MVSSQQRWAVRTIYCVDVVNIAKIFQLNVLKIFDLLYSICVNMFNFTTCELLPSVNSLFYFSCDCHANDVWRNCHSTFQNMEQDHVKKEQYHLQNAPVSSKQRTRKLQTFTVRIIISSITSWDHIVTHKDIGHPWFDASFINQKHSLNTFFMFSLFSVQFMFSTWRVLQTPIPVTPCGLSRCIKLWLCWVE